MPSSPIAFTKMHALGNDFIVLDAVQNPVILNPAMLACMADRRTGIGFDQCLVLEKSPEPEYDFIYRIFNADGTEVGQCANGARCVARFAQTKKLTEKKTFTLKTKTTSMSVQVHEDAAVTVNLGIPEFAAPRIPCTLAQTDTYTLIINEQTIHFHALSLGNPHIVCPVEDVNAVPVAILGQILSEHPVFPERCNVGFMQILSSESIRLRVYERGVGETDACGSGAAAAAVAARVFHKLMPDITVYMHRGTLSIQCNDAQSPVFLKGSASFVFEGIYTPCAL